jgi:hypothetical protein
VIKILVVTRLSLANFPDSRFFFLFSRFSDCQVELKILYGNQLSPMLPPPGQEAILAEESSTQLNVVFLQKNSGKSPGYKKPLRSEEGPSRKCMKCDRMRNRRTDVKQRIRSNGEITIFSKGG